MRFPAPIRASLRLSGLRSSRGGFDILSDVERHIDLPERFGPLELERCRAGCALLADKLGRDPARALALLGALGRHDSGQVRLIAEELGISEDHSTADGDASLMWLAVVVLLLYAIDAA